MNELEIWTSWEGWLSRVEEVRIVRWKMTVRVGTCGFRLRDKGRSKKVNVCNPISMAMHNPLLNQVAMRLLNILACSCYQCSLASLSHNPCPNLIDVVP